MASFETFRIPVEKLPETIQSDLYESIADRVEAFWQVLDMVKDDWGCVAQPQYCKFNRNIQQALNPAPTKEEASRVALDDWARDLQGSVSSLSSLDREGFYQCMFELCAYWAHEHSISEYQAFLDALLGAMTYADGHGLRWLETSQIHKITSGKPLKFQGAKRAPSRLVHCVRGERAAVRTGPLAFGSRLKTAPRPSSPPKTARSRSRSVPRMKVEGLVQIAAAAAPTVLQTSPRGLLLSGAATASTHPRRQAVTARVGLVDTTPVDVAPVGSVRTDVGSVRTDVGSVRIDGVAAREERAGEHAIAADGVSEAIAGRRRSANLVLSEALVVVSHRNQRRRRASVPQMPSLPQMACHSVPQMPSVPQMAVNADSQMPKSLLERCMVAADPPTVANGLGLPPSIPKALPVLPAVQMVRALLNDSQIKVRTVLQDTARPERAAAVRAPLQSLLQIPEDASHKLPMPDKPPLPAPPPRGHSDTALHAQKFGRRGRRASLPQPISRPLCPETALQEQPKSVTAPTPFAAAEGSVMPQPPQTANDGPTVRRRRRMSVPERELSLARGRGAGEEAQGERPTMGAAEFDFDNVAAQSSRAAIKLRLLKSRVSAGEVLTDRWLAAQNRAWVGADASGKPATARESCPWLGEKLSIDKVLGGNGKRKEVGGALHIVACAAPAVE